jgi:glycosyltransferase involved in cell wall biosynthesis
VHIVQIHHERLPVARYGGAERIVVWLCEALVAMGHEVTLLAAPGSRVPGVRVIPVAPRESRSPDFDPRPLLPTGVDILHYHMPVARAPTLPWVWTLHGNMGPDERAGPRTIAVSEDHARRHGITRFVHNGVRLDEFRYATDKQDYDLFIGRMHSAKGWQVAIAAARRCRVRLVLAGGWRPVFSRYVRFVGRVGGARKRELLAGARCLWMPVQWDEPFGLTAIEALASGTPVLGTPRGALPEIVTPEAGGLATTLDELVALRQRLGEWSPAAARARAERYFSHERMARDYLRMYEHLLAHGELPPGRRADAG